MNIHSDYSKSKCFYQEKETQNHIYYCKQLNKKEIEEEYENVYNGNTKQQRKIMKRFQENLKIRDEVESGKTKADHGIPLCDPPFSVIVECGNI